MPKRGEIEKAKTQQGSDQQYVNLVLECFTQSRDHYAPWFRDSERRYKLYRGYKQGRTIPFRNNITLPLAFSMIQSGIARKMEFVGSGPPIAFEAGGPEDQMVARKRTTIINKQLYDSRFLDKETRTLACGDIYGLALSRYYWDIEKELVKFRADLGDGGGERSFEGEQITFDGPNYEPLNLRNSFPQPRIPRIWNMRWFIYRFFLDMEDVNRLAENGFYLKRGARAAADNPLFRQDQQDDVLATHEDPASGMADGATRINKYEKPIEILEFYGRVPRSMQVDGQVNLVISVANRSHLLRNVPNPYGKIPILEDGPMPDPEHFHRPSKLEVIEKIAVASNSLASQKADAVTLTVDPQYVYNSRATTRPLRLWSRPGALHRWEGPVDDANFRPLTPDLRGLVNAYQELEQHAQWMEQGTGVIRDAIQGFGGPDRETAHGFLGRQKSANIRLTMETRIHEHLHTEPLAMAFVDLDRRYLDFPQQIQMLGAAALIDPLTLQPLPQILNPLTVNEMLPDYDARAMGSLRIMGKQQQLQNLAQIGTLAASNPIGVQMVNWIFFFRQLFMLADIPNVDEMLNTDPLMQQVMQLAAEEGNNLTGGQPNAPAKEPTTVLPALGDVG